MLNVFQYLDYREFLQDFFEESRKENPKFSNRYFSAKAGIRSPGFIRDVIARRRKLSQSALHKLLIGLDFATAAERDYFTDLVALDQSKQQTEREHYLEKIHSKRDSFNIKEIKDREYRYFSEHYHSILRQLVVLMNTANPEKLTRKMIPPISILQAKRSVQLLLELGVIKNTKEGYKLEEPFMKAGGKVRDTILVNFQKKVLANSMLAWDRFPKGQISAHAITVALPETALDKIREEARKFRDRVFHITRYSKGKPKRIYQININLFPTTSRIE